MLQACMLETFIKPSTFSKVPVVILVELLAKKRQAGQNGKDDIQGKNEHCRKLPLATGISTN